MKNWCFQCWKHQFYVNRVNLTFNSWFLIFEIGHGRWSQARKCIYFYNVMFKCPPFHSFSQPLKYTPFETAEMRVRSIWWMAQLIPTLNDILSLLPVPFSLSHSPMTVWLSTDLQFETLLKQHAHTHYGSFPAERAQHPTNELKLWWDIFTVNRKIIRKPFSIGNKLYFLPGK